MDILFIWELSKMSTNWWMSDGILFGASRFVDELFQRRRGIVPDSGRPDPQWWLEVPVQTQWHMEGKGWKQPQTEPSCMWSPSGGYYAWLFTNAVCFALQQLYEYTTHEFISPVQPLFLAPRTTSPKSSWQMYGHAHAMSLPQGGLPWPPNYRHLQHLFPVFYIFGGNVDLAHSGS